VTASEDVYDGVRRHVMAPAAGRRSGTPCLSRPWLDRSAADHLLVSLPYSMGMRLEHCELSNRPARFPWLVPIRAEAGYARQRGTEPLERLLDQSGADLLAANRRSLL
jgi:hypothetical protein